MALSLIFFTEHNDTIKDVTVMKMTTLVSMIFLFSFSLFAQNTYYVSSSEGNDNNPGTIQLPWKTFTRINNGSFAPGDKIFFKRGDTWYGTLNPPTNGTPNNYITYDAYDSGNKPNIDGLIAYDGGWTQYSGFIYKSDVNVGYKPQTVTYNGVHLKLMDPTGNSTSNANTNYYVAPTEVGTWDLYEGYLYINVGSVPAGVVKHMTNTINNGLYLYRKSYLAIRNLHISNFTGPIGMQNDTKYIMFDSCLVEYGGETSVVIYDYCTFKNGVIRNGLGHAFYNTPINQTVDGRDVRGWIIDNNEFYNNVGMVFQINGGLNQDYRIVGAQITRNKMWNNGVTFGGVINQTGSGNGFKTACMDSTLFAFNYIHNSAHRDIFLHANLDDVGGDGTDMNDHIFIYNNTLVRDVGIPYNQTDMIRADAISNDTTKFWFYNNIVYNGGQIASRSTFDFAAGVQYSANNNLYFSPNSQPLGKIGGNSYSSLSSWQSRTGQDLNSKYGNPLFTLISNDNFGILPGSPAIGMADKTVFNGWKNIYSMDGVQITDAQGNVVLSSALNAGASQNLLLGDNTPPTLTNAVLTDSTKLLLTFSEGMSSNDVNNLSNYIITNGISVLNAQLTLNLTQIILTTSPHTYGQTYTISVFDLMDLSNNLISSSQNFAQFQSNFNPPSMGGLNKLNIINVNASDTNDVNFGPEKTVDGLGYTNGGNPFSCWATRPMPQSLTYDLGSQKNFSKTKISFEDYYNNRTYKYSILVSNDENNWTTLLSNVSSDLQEWSIREFAATTARFVRFVIHSSTNNPNNWVTVWETEIWGGNSQSTIVNAKAFLQGPYNGTLMSASLSDSLRIPLTQPFNNTPWNYSGSETVQSIPQGVVDWILVELRTDTSAGSIAGRKAALIKTNGLIVDLDGSSPVAFPTVPSGEYYLILKHRNHLPIMSTNKLTLNTSSSLYDFTDNMSKAFGNNPMANLGNNVFGMCAGDGDRNGIVNVLDYGTVGNSLFTTGYLQGDLDMNSIINVLDYGKTNSNLFRTSQVP